MRTVLDRFYRNFSDAPSDLHSGVNRHDDQADRARPYLRALVAKGANGTRPRRGKPGAAAAARSPVSRR